ncbi:MAG: TonB family protein [Magnetococcales bacterium]|nr:TonB family protein [Magnetococcales bacterium]
MEDLISDYRVMESKQDQILYLTLPLSVIAHALLLTLLLSLSNNWLNEGQSEIKPNKIMVSLVSYPNSTSASDNQPELKNSVKKQQIDKTETTPQLDDSSTTKNRAKEKNTIVESPTKSLVKKEKSVDIFKKSAVANFPYKQVSTPNAGPKRKRPKKLAQPPKKILQKKPVVKPAHKENKIIVANKPAATQLTKVNKEQIKPQKESQLSRADQALSHSFNGAAREKNKGAVKLSISKLISRHFVYPPLAKRRNWEGRVVVWIQVEPSGIFSHVEVLESSGFLALDSAATKTVTKLGRIPKSTVATFQKAIQIHLPIIYRLEG